MQSSRSSALRIFATSAAPARPTRPSTAYPVVAVAPAPAPSSAPLHDALDARLLAVLLAPPLASETALICFERKERALLAVFEALSAIESRALHLRLTNPRAGDALAARFGHLAVDRRARLLTFLADARRREALRR